MATPEEQFQIQVSLFFLSHRMTLKSLVTRSFKMLPGISSDVWQHAVYHPTTKSII